MLPNKTQNPPKVNKELLQLLQATINSPKRLSKQNKTKQKMKES